MARENINAFWAFVKEKYPDARFDFWYHTGELHFYPNGYTEEHFDHPFACIRKDGRLVIVYDY